MFKIGRKSWTPKIVTLDTETIDLDGALKKIAIFDGEKVYYGDSFYDIAPQLEFYFNNGEFPHIYIHNADFDLRKIPEIFECGNVLWNTTKKINNRYARLTCKKYTIHDSIKIFPFSLAKISKDFDLEHGKLDLWDAVQKQYPNQYRDHVDFLNRCDKNNTLYLEYLGYDVISLYEALQKLMEIAKLDVNDFIKIMSTASLSRYLFKNGHGEIKFQDTERDKTDFEILCSCKAWSSKKPMKNTIISYLECEYKIRQAFYGGRTEVFTPICDSKAFHYDVNSLYPSVMIDNEFPVGYPEYISDTVIAAHRFKQWLKRKIGLGFIKADVFIPKQTIPPLPSKLGKLAFITGHITGYWTFNELEYAIHHCGVEIKHIHEVIYFKNTYKVFHHFVGEFYKLKEQGTKEHNNSLRNFAKLILNTAYGWTVLKRDDKTALRDISKLEEWKEKDPDRILYSNDILGFFEIRDNVNADTIQVPIGAYVTSYARIVLLDALRKQAEKGTVYYCDTDSIVCEKPLPPDMVDGSRLGAWDLEKEIDSGIFIQPKVYVERVNGKDEIKFKGITKKRQGQLDIEFYKEIIEKLKAGSKEKIIIERDRKSLPTLAVSQKNNTNPNQFNVMDKGMNLGAKQKREIDYNRNHSEPWHMETLSDFNNFNFNVFDVKPDDKNLFGG